MIYVNTYQSWHTGAVQYLDSEGKVRICFNGSRDPSVYAPDTTIAIWHIKPKNKTPSE